MCLFNVVLCPMLKLLSIFFNALYMVVFVSFFVASTLLVIALTTNCWNFMWKDKYIYFTNLVLYNPFTLFLVIGDYFLCTIVTRPCILLIVCFCIFVFCIEFSNSSSSFFLQVEFLMQRRFLFSNYETVVRFILLISLSFNLNGYFPWYRKAKTYHLGFWFWSYPSDSKCPLCNVCVSGRICACF